jgi:hypothetical protein
MEVSGQLCSAGLAGPATTAPWGARLSRTPAPPALLGHHGTLLRWFPFGDLFLPVRHGNCLPSLVTSALLAFAFRWTPDNPIVYLAVESDAQDTLKTPKYLSSCDRDERGCGDGAVSMCEQVG